MAVERPVKAPVSMTIERMQSGDVEQVAELDKQCFPMPWSVAAYATEVGNPSAYYVVARAEGVIIGYAGAWFIMDESHITTIGVAPAFRGHKVGERILVHILEEAVHRGARRATLEVRRTNSAAQNLYHKYGFSTVAIRKGYYSDNGEDAFVMWVDDMWSDDFLRVLRESRERLPDGQ